MSYPLRFVTIAEHYSKSSVGELGVEKAYQVVRLARIDQKVRRTPEQLVKSNPRFGKRRLGDMTAKEVEMMVAGLQRKPKPPPPRAPKSVTAAVDRLVENWEESIGLAAEFEVDAEAQVVRIEIRFDEL